MMDSRTLRGRRGSMESYRRIDIRSEPDSYGFSVLAAQRLGLVRPRRCYCAWLHGWIWWDATRPEQLGYGNLAKDIRLVCVNEAQRQMLLSHGHEDVVAGGLPFSYVPPANVEREKDSLLV